MGKTVAQKALCLPASAGRAVPPGCSWRMLPRSPAPILRTRLEGRGRGDTKPRETRASSPFLLVRHQEEGRLPATADWALLHPVSLRLVRYTCFSSLEGTEGPNILLLTCTCPPQYGTLWTMGYQVLSHLQHPPKLRLLYTSCPLHPKHIFHLSGKQTRIFGPQWGKRIGGTVRRQAVALGWEKLWD